MADLTSPADTPRWLQPTTRSDLQVTWHDEDDRVVISVWRGASCVGSAPLSLQQTASLTTFLVSHLGRRASTVRRLDGPVLRGSTGSARRPAQTVRALLRLPGGDRRRRGRSDATEPIG